MPLSACRRLAHVQNCGGTLPAVLFAVEVMGAG